MATNHNKNKFTGKTIVVTGGAGSIGSEIVRQLLKSDAKKLIIIDTNESGLFYLKENIESIKSTIPVDYFIANIREKARLGQILAGSDIIFHAAALKHVSLCESNPFEAIKTNVFGTQNLIEIAINECVEKFLTISTDKAVNPINSMGATKLLAEKLTLNASGKGGGTKLSCVRFGNVLNSIGSVMPIFIKQISEGGPLTITDPQMTRFFMSMDDAVGLVIRASTLMKGGEIYILKMQSVKILDLAECMIEILAPKYGFKPKEIKKTIIGIRPGEKLFEELINQSELNFIEELKDMYVVHPGRRKISIKNQRILSNKGYNSAFMKPIDRSELMKILKKELE